MKWEQVTGRRGVLCALRRGRFIGLGWSGEGGYSKRGDLEGVADGGRRGGRKREERESEDTHTQQMRYNRERRKKIKVSLRLRMSRPTPAHARTRDIGLPNLWISCRLFMLPVADDSFCPPIL